MVAFTGRFADDVFAVPGGDNRYDGLDGNDAVIFKFKLIDAVFSYSGNEVIVDTATSHTVLTEFQTYRSTHGTVEENDGNLLVADVFYFFTPAVAQSLIDEITHTDPDTTFGSQREPESARRPRSWQRTL